MWLSLGDPQDKYWQRGLLQRQRPEELGRGWGGVGGHHPAIHDGNPGLPGEALRLDHSMVPWSYLLLLSVRGSPSLRGWLPSLLLWALCHSTARYSSQLRAEGMPMESTAVTDRMTEQLSWSVQG